MDQSTGPLLNATPPMQNRLLIGPPANKLDSASLFPKQQCFNNQPRPKAVVLGRPPEGAVHVR